MKNFPLYLNISVSFWGRGLYGENVVGDNYGGDFVHLEGITVHTTTKQSKLDWTRECCDCGTDEESFTNEKVDVTDTKDVKEVNMKIENI